MRYDAWRSSSTLAELGIATSAAQTEDRDGRGRLSPGLRTGTKEQGLRPYNIYIVSSLLVVYTVPKAKFNIWETEQGFSFAANKML